MGENLRRENAELSYFFRHALLRRHSRKQESQSEICPERRESGILLPFLWAVAGLASLMLALSAQAAEIKLSSGVKIDGVISAESAGKVVIETTSGTLVFPREKVVSIKRGEAAEEKSLENLFRAEKHLREGNRELAEQSLKSIDEVVLPAAFRAKYENLRATILTPQNPETHSLDAAVVSHAQQLAQREQKDQALAYLKSALVANPQLTLSKKYFFYLLENDIRKRERYCFYLADLVCSSSERSFDSELSMLFERSIRFSSSYLKEGDFLTAKNYAFLAACLYAIKSSNFNLGNREDWCSIISTILSDIQLQKSTLTSVPLAKAQAALIDLAYEQQQKAGFLLQSIIPCMDFDLESLFQLAMSSEDASDWRACAQLWASLEWWVLCHDRLRAHKKLVGAADPPTRLIKFRAVVESLNAGDYVHNPIRAVTVRPSAAEGRRFLSAPAAEQWEQILLFLTSLPNSQVPHDFLEIAATKVLELAPSGSVAREYFCPKLMREVKTRADQIGTKDPTELDNEIKHLNAQAERIQCGDRLSTEIAAIQALLGIFKDYESSFESRWRRASLQERAGVVKVILAQLDRFHENYRDSFAAERLPIIKNSIQEKVLSLLRRAVLEIRSCSVLLLSLDGLSDEEIQERCHVLTQEMILLSSLCEQMGQVFPSQKDFTALRLQVDRKRLEGEEEIWEALVTRQRQRIRSLCDEYLDKQPDYDEIRSLWLDGVPPLVIGNLLRKEFRNLSMDNSLTATQARVSYVMTFQNTQDVLFEDAKVDILLQKTQAGWKIVGLEFLGKDDEHTKVGSSSNRWEKLNQKRGESHVY